jgi:hypothetical protein
MAVEEWHIDWSDKKYTGTHASAESALANAAGLKMSMVAKQLGTCTTTCYIVLLGGHHLVSFVLFTPHYLHQPKDPPEEMTMPSTP